MTSPKTKLRRELAEFLHDVLGADMPVLPSPPAELRGGSAFVSGQPAGYVSHRESGATFCKPVVKLRIVVVAPANDWPARHDWLDEQHDLIADALQSTKKIGEFPCPRIDNVQIAMVAEKPGLLGMNIDLTPVNVS